MSPTPRPTRWTVERAVPLLAGIIVLASAALAVTLSSWFLLLTAFVGANLILYSAVGWCPASLLMHRMGLPRTTAPQAQP